MKRLLFFFALTLLGTSCERASNPGRLNPVLDPSYENVFLKGGDISMLSLVEKNGGKYYLDGVETDV